jgi:dTDP-4-dehydrorhamnose reductase
LKILLTGKNGQVGWELLRTLAPLGEVLAFDHAALDLADPDRIARAVREARPQVIVNAAAYTAVDKAESEPALAQAINARAPGILADEAKKLGALLVHYSTDYVFDGAKQGPYTEDDAPNPLSVYGRTKLEGERAIRTSGCRHLIFSTSWIYGPRGKNFLLTILRLAKERDELRVVDDQIGAPTSSDMIADTTAHILLHQDRDPPNGIYHLTASGQTSWFGFASAIVRGAGLGARVIPIPGADYPTPAKRPRNSVLDTSKLDRVFGLTLPRWEDGLATCMEAVAKQH